MIDFSEFESISPYSDEEAVKALSSIADNSLIDKASQFVFPEQEPTYLGSLLKEVTSINDFQAMVMSKVVERIISTSIRNFSYEGIANLEQEKGKFLVMSNHRDIIIDPAITQYILFCNNMPQTEIAVGDNLIQNSFIEALIKSNRMIKVVRGISARELYLSSQMLSKYIRLKITSGESSVWLAQRQGRTKNGVDITEQGLLKMLDMSGTGSFQDNFNELNIIPVSISYEYEPCDILKARELLISRDHKYVKAPGEDTNSILTGIKQWKGDVHLSIGKKLSHEEVAAAAECDKNDRYQLIRHAVDLRVIKGYKLWKTNFIAYDLKNKTNQFSDRYTTEEKEVFIAYINKQMETVEPELDRNELREIFLGIYAGPISSKMLLNMQF